MPWRTVRRALVLCTLLPAAACMNKIEQPPPPPPVVEAPKPAFEQVGKASWYGPFHHGRKTASGEKFDMNDLTAAHRTLPLGTEAKVTNLENGRSVTVTVNDRGPYKQGRVIDLSKRAAETLGMKEDGLAEVKIEVLPGQAPVETATIGH
jgi:rare lipoprotein A